MSLDNILRLSENKYIIGFVDWYNMCRPKGFAIPDKTAETVAHLLSEEIIIPRYSTPLHIVTDNGSENTCITSHDVMSKKVSDGLDN